MKQRVVSNEPLASDIRDFRSSEVADDQGCVRFLGAMIRKLNRKREEGRGGWNLEPYTVQQDRGDRVQHGGCTVADLRNMLKEHIEKGDPVDIANFCMMIWNRENPNG